MPRFRLFPSILVAVLVGACGLVIILARQQSALRRDYTEYRRLATDLHSGSVVPPFHTASLEGDPLTIGESSDSLGRQLLFVLTTTCPYCEATLPTWAKLADSARRLTPWHVQVVGISLDSAEKSRAYAAVHEVGYPLVLFPNRKFTRLYRASRVPQTVVLDHEGNVLFARLGLLGEPAVIDSIYEALTWKRSATSTTAGAKARAP